MREINIIDIIEIFNINDDVDLYEWLKKFSDTQLKSFCKATMQTVNDVKQIQKILK